MIRMKKVQTLTLNKDNSFKWAVVSEEVFKSGRVKHLLTVLFDTEKAAQAHLELHRPPVD